MKNWIACILVIGLLVSLTACQRGNGETIGETTPSTKPSAEHDQTTSPTETTPAESEFDPATWGAENRYAVYNNGSEISYYINTARYRGNNLGTGLMCEQLDGTMTLVSGQRDYSPVVENISEVFPALENQVTENFVYAYGMLTKDFVFTYSESKAVTVGEYEMHSFAGELSFAIGKNPKNYPFVAYATKLKSNGAYAYWMVFDITENNGAKDLLVENAYKMALTFREDQ